MDNGPEGYSFGALLSVLRDSVRGRPRSASPGKARVLENFFSLSALQVARYVFPLIALPYLLRVVGFANYGLIAFAQALVAYLVTLTDYGFNFTATRDIAQHRSDPRSVSKIFFSVMFAKALLVLVSLGILVAIVFTVPGFARNWPLYLFTFGSVPGNALFPTWFFQGIEDMKCIAVLGFVDRLLFTLLLFVFIRHSWQYLYVPLVNSVGVIIAGAAGAVIAIRRIGAGIIIPRWNEICAQFKAGWHVFVSNAAVTGYGSTRIFAVGLFAAPAITGAYALAERLTGVAYSFGMVPLQQAIYPRLAELYVRSRTRSFQVMAALQRLVTMAWIALALVAFWVAPFLVRLIAGAGSPTAALAFRLLLVGVVLGNANILRLQFLLVAGLDKTYSRIVLGESLVGILLSFGGAYAWSYLGPAASVIAVQAVGIILAVGVVWRNPVAVGARAAEDAGA